VPRDRIKALRAVRETGGEFVVVSDEEILEAMRVLGQTAGVFAEPAGAAPLAGLQRMLHDNRVDPEERIVVLVTGNGLKDVNSAIRAVEAPQRIEPTVDDLRRLVDQLGIEAVAE
jgi:threonine synthase